MLRPIRHDLFNRLLSFPFFHYDDVSSVWFVEQKLYIGRVGCLMGVFCLVFVFCSFVSLSDLLCQCNIPLFHY